MQTLRCKQNNEIKLTVPEVETVVLPSAEVVYFIKMWPLNTLVFDAKFWELK